MDKTRQELAQIVVSEFKTQEELAKICGISQSAISLWLRRGLPRAWELFLRARFPNLKAWAQLSSPGAQS